MFSKREIFFNNIGLPSANPPAIEVDYAEGVFLYDNNGKKYFDLVSGVSVSALGHGNIKVKIAINDQLEKYMHLMVYGKFIQEPQINLAGLLTENLPEKLNCSYFVNSGSEAIEGALKLAKRFTGRTEMVSFRNAYHGGTHGALSVLGGEEMRYAFRPLLPDVKQLEFNNVEQLEQISSRTACVIIEPVQAEAGIILPENDFLKKVRQRCDETGAILIFDEIQMGMGRTGKLFCFENYDVVPDILCLAKAFGGGMPLGAFISSKDCMRSLTHHPELGHITTFGGHPVSCAAAYTTLRELTETDLIETAAAKAEIYLNALKDHPKVKAVRSIGLMLGIDLQSIDAATKLSLSFLEEGIIVDQFLFRPYAFRIAPPLTISEKEIEESINIIIRCLNNL